MTPSEKRMLIALAKCEPNTGIAIRRIGPKRVATGLVNRGFARSMCIKAPDNSVIYFVSEAGQEKAKKLLDNM